MKDKDKIKADVKKLQNELHYLPFTDENIGRMNAYETVIKIIDSLPEEPFDYTNATIIQKDFAEPASEDLEEESYHAAMRMVNNHDLILPSTTIAQLCTAYQNFYKEAANWQKEQMIDKACELVVNCIEDFMLRRMELWHEDSKQATLKNIRKAMGGEK